MGDRRAPRWEQQVGKGWECHSRAVSVLVLGTERWILPSCVESAGSVLLSLRKCCLRGEAGEGSHQCPTLLCRAKNGPLVGSGT